MGLKKLEDINRKQDDFINSAKAETKKRKKTKTVKIREAEVFTKQSVKLDESRYIKITKYCKKNKISFQDLILDLIDNFLSQFKAR